MNTDQLAARFETLLASPAAKACDWIALSEAFFHAASRPSPRRQRLEDMAEACEDYARAACGE